MKQGTHLLSAGSKLGFLYGTIGTPDILYDNEDLLERSFYYVFLGESQTGSIFSM
ncbi:hypothetical protein GCM10007096_31850 [Pullulanibacillus pueri]|uniref:Uncharacterized protein n=1 Tax=Pullulanibacillus pueri TaxID=1437324 RepID=A0A8J3ENV6_9BACL|nr:hypothetical protein GCM10007096_31850 [Pullulanibacillus pueri]